MKKLSSKEILLISGFLIAVGAVCFWLFFLAPFKKTREADAAKTLEVAAVLDQTQKIEEQMVKTMGVENYNELYKRTQESLPLEANMRSQDIINIIIDLKEELKIPPESISYGVGKPESLSARLTVLPVNVTMTATYENTLKFIEALYDPSTVLPEEKLKVDGKERKFTIRLNNYSFRPRQLVSTEGSALLWGVDTSFTVEMLYQK